MLKTILIAVPALAAVFLIAAALQPAEFSLSRSIVIAAPPAKVVPLVSDFHRWSGWSPWEKLDPGMTRTYSGAASGQGAVYEWSGNAKIGAGRMTILESRPEEIDIRLEFLRPMKAVNLARFTFVPEAGGTRVTWSMSGHNNLVAKALHLVFSMEKMVGPSFEQGLAGMKALAEAVK